MPVGNLSVWIITLWLVFDLNFYIFTIMTFHHDWSLVSFSWCSLCVLNELYFASCSLQLAFFYWEEVSVTILIHNVYTSQYNLEALNHRISWVGWDHRDHWVFLSIHVCVEMEKMVLFDLGIFRGKLVEINSFNEFFRKLMI